MALDWLRKDSNVLPAQSRRNDATKSGRLDMRRSRHCRGQMRKDANLNMRNRMRLNRSPESEAKLKFAVV